MRPISACIAVLCLMLSESAWSEGAFSNEPYARVLKEFVDAEGMVNYRSLKAGRADLDSYIHSLGILSPNAYEKWREPDKIAFWCNAYNAITLKYIIDNYPIQSGGWISGFRFPANSIRQIDGVWDTKTTSVMGKPMTLDSIEHEVLRVKFDEPRIHMAIVCASIGCPFLRSEPFEGDKLEKQLADQTKIFVNSAIRFRIDRPANVVYISPIFKWFGGDFVSKYGGASGFSGLTGVEQAVINFISRHTSDTDTIYLEQGDYDIAYLDYDWSLNEQS